MPTIKTGIKLDSQFLNLKEINISEVRSEVMNLLIPSEEILAAFKTVMKHIHLQAISSALVRAINIQAK